VTPPSFDTGSAQTVAITVTNAGIKPWAATGTGSVGLIWEIRDAQKRLASASSAPIALPALAPALSSRVNLSFTAPPAVGAYTLTVGLADSTGRALTALGAATGSFTFNTHVTFLVSATSRVPQILHRNEASLLIVQYSDLPAGANAAHTYALFWRAIDPLTAKVVGSGSSPLGVSTGSGSGTFFSSIVAPGLRGSFKLAVEIREGDRTVSDVQTIPVEIAGPRTYPGDRDSAAQLGPRGTPPPRPSGATPRPSPSGTPRGRTPPPTPTR
jgi:hypothetical protein